MRKLRIVNDENGRPWIEQENGDGQWSRAEHSGDEEPLRAGEVRSLNASRVDEIARAIDHPQQKFAEEVQSFARNLAAAVPNSVRDALKGRFALADPLVSKSEVDEVKERFTAPIPRSTLEAFKLPDLPDPAPDPTYEVIAMLDKQNQILEKQRDDARDEATKSAKHAWWSLALAWTAIGLTVVVSIAQICVDVFELRI